MQKKKKAISNNVVCGKRLNILFCAETSVPNLEQVRCYQFRKRDKVQFYATKMLRKVSLRTEYATWFHLSCGSHYLLLKFCKKACKRLDRGLLLQIIVLWMHKFYSDLPLLPSTLGFAEMC